MVSSGVRYSSAWMRSVARRGQVFACLLLLTGCGGAATTPTPTAPPGPGISREAVSRGTPVATLAGPALSEIVWAVSVDPDTGVPLSITTQYTPEVERLTASLLAHNLASGTTIDAVWSYNNTALDAFDTQLIINDPAPSRWLRFDLDRSSDEQWPVGTYSIEVSLSGGSPVRADVEVAATE